MLTSILDNDLYKFTMQNAVIKLFPRSKVRYEFINRGTNELPLEFKERLEYQISQMSKLALTNEEKKFLERKCYYMDPTYIDFLKGYRFDPNEVKVNVKGGELKIDIEGYWYRTILWEVPLLALVSEIYFNYFSEEEIYTQEEITQKLKDKFDIFNRMKLKVADFGTRRRYSYENHDLIIERLKDFGKPAFTGTSNVHLAMKHDVTPIGTHAHEWFMYHAAKYGFKMANKLALENWVRVYQGDLGIALSDTFTSEVFFNSFDKKLAKLFDGVRQDSGDPIEFANNAIKFYENKLIDPKSKTIIFSDSLDAEKVQEIAEHFKDKIKIAFGIGTNLTNDVGVEPLNIVIKMTEAKPFEHEWIPTVKLSDSKGKFTGDEEMIEICKKTLAID